MAPDRGLDRLAGHTVVAIDSNVFVYLFESTGPLNAAAAAAVDAVNGRHVIFASVGLTEVLGGPARGGDRALMERYVDEIRSVDGLRVIDLDAEIAFAAAIERGRSGGTLGDVIHVATARASGATALITNDRRLRSTPGLEVIPLAAFAA